MAEMRMQKSAPAATGAGKSKKVAAAVSAKRKSASAPAEADLRQKLAAARQAHVLQKLESPATLRKLRRDLARVLTRQRATTKSAKQGESGE